jgi:hypothetical protein
MIQDRIESKQVCKASASDRFIWGIAKWGCDEDRLEVRNMLEWD